MGASSFDSWTVALHTLNVSQVPSYGWESLRLSRSVVYYLYIMVPFRKVKAGLSIISLKGAFLHIKLGGEYHEPSRSID